MTEFKILEILFAELLKCKIGNWKISLYYLFTITRVTFTNMNDKLYITERHLSKLLLEALQREKLTNTKSYIWMNNVYLTEGNR